MAIYQLTLKQTWLGQQIRNIFYYETDVSNPTASEFQDIIDEIRGYWDSNLKTNLSPRWTFDSMEYRIVDTAGLLSLEVSPTAGVLTGTGSGDDVASQVALLVSVKGTTTKPNRARTYFGGLLEPAIALSQWSVGIVALAVDFIDDMDQLNALGTNPLSRVAAEWNEGHTQVVASNVFSGGIVKGSLVPATQRRRRIGVGI